MNERVGHHVVDVMAVVVVSALAHAWDKTNLLSVSKVVEWTLFIDDPKVEVSRDRYGMDPEGKPNGCFLSANSDALDVIGGLSELLQLVMQGVSGLDSGLGMELRGIRNLEQDVLHHI
jgi:hypothetical protein